MQGFLFIYMYAMKAFYFMEKLVEVGRYLNFCIRFSQTLGVEFDVYEGESMYYNKSKEVIDCLEERGCIER